MTSIFDKDVGCLDIAVEIGHSLGLRLAGRLQLRKQLGKLLLRAHNCFDEGLQFEVSKLSHVDVLERVCVILFDLDQGRLQVHDIVRLYKHGLPFALLALNLLIKHFLLINALDVGLAESFKCHYDLHSKRLLLRVESSRIGAEDDAEGSQSDNLDVFKVINYELRRLSIILQGFHDI